MINSICRFLGATKINNLYRYIFQPLGLFTNVFLLIKREKREQCVFYLKTKKRNKRLFPSMPVSRCILLLPHDAL